MQRRVMGALTGVVSTVAVTAVLAPACMLDSSGLFGGASGTSSGSGPSGAGGSLVTGGATAGSAAGSGGSAKATSSSGTSGNGTATSAGSGGADGGGGTTTGAMSSTTSTGSTGSGSTTTGTGGMQPPCVNDEFWDPATQHCYLLVQGPATWPGARAACLAWGGDLAGLGMQAEIDFIAQHQSPAITGPTWLGGYATQLTCSYLWMDREAWQPRWDAGEPNNQNGAGEYNVELKADGKMNDANPGTKEAYLCERDPARACGDGILQPGEQCDGGPHCLGCKVVCAPGEVQDPLTLHCYRFLVGANQKSWANAKAACVTIGGYLATITSDVEAAVVQPKLLGDTWIGASRPGILQGVVWDDGEPSCYTSWDFLQPSSLAWENCAVIKTNGKWALGDGAQLRDVVCERDP